MNTDKPLPQPYQSQDASKAVNICICDVEDREFTGILLEFPKSLTEEEVHLCKMVITEIFSILLPQIECKCIRQGQRVMIPRPKNCSTEHMQELMLKLPTLLDGAEEISLPCMTGYLAMQNGEAQRIARLG